jgi:hypothetical protein
MLKKLIIFIFIVIIPQLTLASAYCPQTFGLTMAYIGGGFNVSRNVPYNRKEWDNYRNPAGADLFGGYGINWTQYFFSAIEGFGSIATTGNYTWGLRVVPGLYLFSNVMGFATVGFVSGNNYPFTRTHPSTNNGIQFGAGLQLGYNKYDIRLGWYRNNFNVGKKDILSSVDQFYISLIYHFIVFPGIQCPDCPRG